MSDVNLPPSKQERSIPTWAWITGGVLVVALVVLLTLVFTGGDKKSDETESTPSPTVTVTEKAPEPVPSREAGPTLEAAPEGNVQSKEGFSNFLRDMFPVLEGYSDKEITDRAERACDMFDDGASFMDVVEDSVATAKSGEEAEAFGGIVGAGVSIVCPEHTDKIEPYL